MTAFSQRKILTACQFVMAGILAEEVRTSIVDASLEIIQTKIPFQCRVHNSSMTYGITMDDKFLGEDIIKVPLEALTLQILS